MQMQKIHKKGGVVTDLISGAGGIIITVIVALVIVSTLISSNLLTADSTYDNASDNMAANFTQGIGNVSDKIPTILLIGAVVLLFGVIVLLVARSKQMGMGGGSL